MTISLLQYTKIIGKFASLAVKIKQKQINESTTGIPTQINVEFSRVLFCSRNNEVIFIDNEFENAKNLINFNIKEINNFIDASILLYGTPHLGVILLANNTEQAIFEYYKSEGYEEI